MGGRGDYLVHFVLLFFFFYFYLLGGGGGGGGGGFGGVVRGVGLPCPFLKIEKK